MQIVVMATVARKVPTTIGITYFMFICLSWSCRADDVAEGVVVVSVGWITMMTDVGVLAAAIMVWTEAIEVAADEVEITAVSVFVEAVLALGNSFTFLANDGVTKRDENMMRRQIEFKEDRLEHLKGLISVRVPRKE